MEEGEAERMEAPRVGLKAVLRRRREPVVLRRGVKDWKRLVRDGEEGMLGGLVWFGLLLVEGWMGAFSQRMNVVGLLVLKRP